MKHPIAPDSLLQVIAATKQNLGAEFTLQTRKQHLDFTYKIKRSLFKGQWYTQIYVEQEYLNWVFLGNYFRGKIYNKRQVVETQAAVAIAWLFNVVEQGKIEVAVNNVEVFHLGKCLKCGRVLTDAASIEAGLGPVCRG